MSATIISGREIAKAIRAELKERVAELKEQSLVPGLATVLVGDDPASHQYVGMKNKAAGEAGIYSRQVSLPVGDVRGGIAGADRGPECRPRDPRHPRSTAAARSHR